MNLNLNESEFLSEAEQLLFELVETDWFQDSDAPTFMKARSAIEQLDFQVEVKNEELFSFVDRYLHHDNWKFRAGTLLFLEVVPRKFGLSNYNDVRPKLQGLCWSLFNDPERRVVEFLLRIIKEWVNNRRHDWFDMFEWSFTRLTIKEATLLTFDFDWFLQRLPDIAPELQPGFFWGMVCIVAERIRRGEGTQLKPFLLRLLEIALPEDSTIRTQGNEWQGYRTTTELLLLGLLSLLWTIPPLHINSEWAQMAVELFGAIELELLADYSDDGNKPFKHILERVGPIICHLQDWDLLNRFLEASSWLFAYEIYGSCWEHNMDAFLIIERLLPNTIEANWDEATHYFLNILINETTHYYNPPITHGDYIWVPGAWARTTGDLLVQYLATGKELDQDLLERLYKLYEKASIALNEPLHPSLDASLVQLGQMLENYKEVSLRDFCLDKQFLPPIRGMLETAVASHNQEWIIQILTPLLEGYKPLFWPETQERPFEASVREDQLLWLQVNLFILLERFVKPIDTVFMGTVFSQLYAQHGIWVLRLVYEVLTYTWNHFRDQWNQCVKTVGEMWAKSSIPTEVSSCQDEEDFPWLLTMLQGCAAHPDAQVPLFRYAEDSTQPLRRRMLSLILQTNFDTVTVDSLLPIYKWHPKSLRVIIAHVLGTLRDPQAVSPLIDTLRDDWPELRAKCAWSLGEIKDPRALDPLLARLEDKDPKVETEVIIALGKLGDPRVIPQLMELWKTIEDQLDTIGTLGLVTMFGFYEEIVVNRILTWRRRAKEVREALRMLGIDVPPLTEKEAFQRKGITIS